MVQGSGFRVQGSGFRVRLESNKEEEETIRDTGVSALDVPEAHEKIVAVRQVHKQHLRRARI